MSEVYLGSNLRKLSCGRNKSIYRLSCCVFYFQMLCLLILNTFLLGDSNEIRTHNHLVRKRTLNHLAKLAKWLSCVVSTYLYCAFDCMLLSCHVRVSVNPLYSWPICQGTPCSKLASYLKFKWHQRDSNTQPLSS